MSELTGHYVDVDGTRIYYEETGQGPPFFCIHTAGACSIEYYELLPLIADAGYRAIAVDLPGHGKSYPVDWGPFRQMREYSAFTWDIIQEVCEQEPIVMGCSIGGNMVTDMACHYSDDIEAALALEGAAHTPTFPDVNTYEHPHACPGWRDIMERAAEQSMYRPVSEEKVTETRWMHRYAPQEVATGDLECWVNHDVRDKLSDISCPFMLFKGEADYYVPDDVMESTIADVPDEHGEFIVGDEMGHYPMFEDPESLADISLDFLARNGVA
ncbi:alpha/beta fold hydrolase [Halorientalis sp.]|uniref:alpha/beta fold hydrolase n=1 Tax=Halorientalis sp. TaxID=1931229 RepID=UPI00260D07AA|nr:alpha/beta hydrolase [Halorientalis sp.]